MRNSMKSIAKSLLVAVAVFGGLFLLTQSGKRSVATSKKAKSTPLQKIAPTLDEVEKSTPLSSIVKDDKIVKKENTSKSKIVQTQEKQHSLKKEKNVPARPIRKKKTVKKSTQTPKKKATYIHTHTSKEDKFFLRFDSNLALDTLIKSGRITTFACSSTGVFQLLVNLKSSIFVNPRCDTYAIQHNLRRLEFPSKLLKNTLKVGNADNYIFYIGFDDSLQRSVDNAMITFKNKKRRPIIIIQADGTISVNPSYFAGRR